MIKHGLMKHVSSQFDLFLYPFVKLTEPDPLPWFTKWSSGRLVVLLWSLTSLLLVLFYTSNLRANMIMVNYEPEPRTLLDVAERGERVYMYDLAVIIL